MINHTYNNFNEAIYDFKAFCSIAAEEVLNIIIDNDKLDEFVNLIDNSFNNTTFDSLDNYLREQKIEIFKKLDIKENKTMEHAEELFIDIAEQYEEYDDIEDRIGSLYSCGELTDEEYNYIITEWDNLLVKHNL